MKWKNDIVEKVERTSRGRCHTFPPIIIVRGTTSCLSRTLIRLIASQRWMTLHWNWNVHHKKTRARKKKTKNDQKEQERFWQKDAQNWQKLSNPYDEEKECCRTKRKEKADIKIIWRTRKHSSAGACIHEFVWFECQTWSGYQQRFQVHGVAYLPNEPSINNKKERDGEEEEQMKEKSIQSFSQWSMLVHVQPSKDNSDTKNESFYFLQQGNQSWKHTLLYSRTSCHSRWNSGSSTWSSIDRRSPIFPSHSSVSAHFDSTSEYLGLHKASQRRGVTPFVIETNFSGQSS